MRRFSLICYSFIKLSRFALDILLKILYIKRDKIEEGSVFYE